MIDRFKFRVWRPTNTHIIDWKPQFIYQDILEADYCVVRQDNDVYEFCTGLKDKNGKLIYEGDIIRCLYKTESCDGVVVWDNEEAGFSILVDGELYSFAQRKDDDITIIIGNIHENKNY